MPNLLRSEWSNLDSHELRLLLDRRFLGLGQQSQADNPNNLYLPEAGSACRLILTFRDGDIAAVKQGQAFNEAEWRSISDEIENGILTGTAKVGRGYSFSSMRVTGFWRGAQSGVKILPPGTAAPEAPTTSDRQPFILEFPIDAAPDDLSQITLYRRMREHRRLILLLNILLTARIGHEPRRTKYFWAYTPSAECQWLPEGFFAPLDAFSDELSPPAGPPLSEEDSGDYLTDGTLKIPAGLDESICLYRGLSKENRAKFGRAAFWFGMASQQWTTSISSSFASLVSAIKSLIGRGTQHVVHCAECGTDRSHDVPGATKSFRLFLERYAPGRRAAKVERLG